MLPDNQDSLCYASVDDLIALFTPLGLVEDRMPTGMQVTAARSHNAAIPPRNRAVRNTALGR
jgi:hypothetical protein